MEEAIIIVIMIILGIATLILILANDYLKEVRYQKFIERNKNEKANRR